MISKCHTAEIQTKVEEYIHNAEWDIRLKIPSQFWIGRLVALYDAIWTLCYIDAISIKTFQALTDPITEFERKHDCELMCRYNNPQYSC